MHRVSVFDTVLAGVLCLLSGVGIALALKPGPWTRVDTGLALAAVAAGSRGGVVLRRLYRAQASETPEREQV